MTHVSSIESIEDAFARLCSQLIELARAIFAEPPQNKRPFKECWNLDLYLLLQQGLRPSLACGENPCSNRSGYGYLEPDELSSVFIFGDTMFGEH